MKNSLQAVTSPEPADAFANPNPNAAIRTVAPDGGLDSLINP